MAKNKEAVPVAELDVGEAEKAFQETLPDLERMAKGDLQAANVDLQVASAIAYSVATRDGKGSRRARLAAVAQGGLFDMALVDGLALRALTAWHVRRKQTEAMHAASDARVPEPVLRGAQQLRARMLRVLTYYYEDNEMYSAQIAAIRAGAGYVDLANDLLALAEFYSIPEVKALLSRDPMHYRESDPADARKLAQRLFEGLGIASTGEAARWTNLAQRAWTLLARDYGLLRAAGQLVFRNDEDVDASYPSLVSAARGLSRGGGQAPATPDPAPPAAAQDPGPIAASGRVDQGHN